MRGYCRSGTQLRCTVPKPWSLPDSCCQTRHCTKPTNWRHVQPNNPEWNNRRTTGRPGFPPHRIGPVLGLMYVLRTALKRAAGGTFAQDTFNCGTVVCYDGILRTAGGKECFYKSIGSCEGGALPVIVVHQRTKNNRTAYCVVLKISSFVGAV